MITLLLILYVNIQYSLSINTKPGIGKYIHSIPLYWKIANKNEFTTNIPKKIIFNNFPIAVYKNKANEIKAISDICLHRGASLSKGKILKNNCVQCPYHGWEYENGIVKNIPGIPNKQKTKNFGIPQFQIKELNNDIYILPTYDVNSKKGIYYNHTIYVPPEANDKKFVRTYGSRHIHRPHNLITENVLDMMHISFVHSFGNNLSPVPFKIYYEDIDELSGKTTFHYTSGPYSMSKIIGGSKFVIVENEFHLPDTTITRVKANDIVKTIVTHCYPIGKNESVLYFDLYRNFLTSSVFDGLFHSQMKITLDEDIKILNSIYDDYILGFMSNKFDITQVKYRQKVNKLINKENK